MTKIRVRVLKAGDTLQVGDYVKVEHPLATHTWKITRLTKTTAVGLYAKSGATQKFTREVRGLRTIPRQEWDKNVYTAYRPIEEERR